MEEAAPELRRERRHISPARRVVYIVFIIVAAVLAYGMGILGMTPFRVPTKSMIDALQPNDYIVAKPQDTYQRGDIVVLHDPLMAGAYLAKRIVGVPGDTISVNYGYLSVNGAYASEPYIREPINYALETIEVPEGDVLVLGDNRNESDDASRWLINPDTGEAVDATNATSDIVGGERWKRTVPMDLIVGKVIFRYLPIARFGKVASFPLTNSEGD